MFNVTHLQTDRTRAANGEGSLIGRLGFFASELAGKGLHAEAFVMMEAAAAIARLKCESDQAHSRNG